VLFNGRVFIFEFKVVSDRAQGKAGNKTGRGKVNADGLGLISGTTLTVAPQSALIVHD
jgi:hypothetical protein